MKQGSATGMLLTHFDESVDPRSTTISQSSHSKTILLAVFAAVKSKISEQTSRATKIPRDLHAASGWEEVRVYGMGLLFA